MTASAWLPVRLSERHRLAVYPTPAAYFADRIRHQQYFSYARFNRDFWEAWRPVRDGDGSVRAERAALLRDLAAEIGGLRDDDPNLFVATSHLRYPNSDRIEAGSQHDDEILATIESTLPAGYVAHDGQLFKRATIDGRIRALYEALRSLRVIAVGPAWLATLKERLKLPRFGLHALDGANGRDGRRQILAALEEDHARLCGEPTAYLFHADLLSPWLVLQLHRKLRNAFLLDLGSALDICEPSRVREAAWGRIHWNAIARNLGFDEEPLDSQRVVEIPRLVGLHDPTPALPPSPARRNVRRTKPARDRRNPIRFVENKAVDFDFVQGALEASARANHWTNFGPATAELEASLGRFLALPDSRRVVMCASGTAAMFALAGLCAYRAGRPMRWVTSAFAFHPARQGPFAGAQVVDCDSEGMLDLAALARFPDDRYDGVLATNVFGALDDPGPFTRFCRERGKVLVLDSALGFDVGYRRGADVPDEIVSFHHTKPWGMGEGGCVIVDADDADAVRSIINFGLFRGYATGSASFNGKISDFSSAFLLQRLRDFSDVSPRYHAQYTRIAAIGRRVGFALLGGSDRPRLATPSNVPLLAPHAVTLEHLANPTVALQKYYQPLAPGHAVAADLYARIVNVPCHPGLEQLPEESLSECLAGVLERSRP